MAKEKFNAAIASSSRNGFLHDRALAHELASDASKPREMIIGRSITLTAQGHATKIGAVVKR